MTYTGEHASSCMAFLRSDAARKKFNEFMAAGDIIEERRDQMGKGGGNGGKENRHNWFANQPDRDDIMSRVITKRGEGLAWADACAAERYPYTTIQSYAKRHKLGEYAQ